MADANGRAAEPALSKADALALAEEAEAEAAEAEALAAAARARARAIRLRREAQVQAAQSSPAEEATMTEEPATAVVAEPVADTEAVETEAVDDTTDVTDTADATDVRPSAVAPEQENGPQSERRIRSATTAAVAAVVLTLGLLGASTYMVWQHHQALQRRQQEAAFMAAARQGIVNMTSFDFNRAKEDVQRVIDSSTGEFRDDFTKRAADFTTVVQQSKVVTEGSVASAAVESVRDDSAVVLVLASERVTNAAGAKDEPREFRLRVTVSRDGDQLKMSKVEFVL